MDGLICTYLYYMFSLGPTQDGRIVFYRPDPQSNELYVQIFVLNWPDRTWREIATLSADDVLVEMASAMEQVFILKNTKSGMEPVYPKPLWMSQMSIQDQNAIFDTLEPNGNRRIWEVPYNNVADYTVKHITIYKVGL